MFTLAEHLKRSQLSSATSNPVASVMGESNILQAAAERINQAEQRLKSPQLLSTLSNPVASVVGESNILQAAAEKINQAEQSLKPPQLLSTLSNPVTSVMGESNILQAAADKIKEQEQRLKNLASMQVKVLRLFMWFTKLFLYAKKLSGPFKPVVEIIERIFRSLILLVLEKVFHVPAELLKLVDSTAGGSAFKIDSLVPPVIGQVSSGAISAVGKVAGLAGGVATEVQPAGVLSSASGLFKKVSSEAVSTVQNAPQVAAGLATKVQGAKVRNEEEELWLKYLAFVQVITLYAVLCFTNVYLYAKERSGPLKPVIKFVEGMVKKVFRFVFDKCFDVLVERLKSGDPTVGEFVIKIDGLVHPGINQVSSDVISAAQKVAGVAGDVYTEVHNVGAGVVNAASGFMKQASSDAISGALKAPGVIGGLVSEVQHAKEVVESVTKTDNLVPPIIKQVSSEAFSSTLKGPIIAGGVVAELQSGVGGIASGLIKQVSSEAISAVEKAPVVGESVTMIDNLVPSVLKQVSSEAISSAQNAAGLATEAQHTGLLSTASGLIKHVSSEATSTVQKAAGVAEGVATEVPHVGILKQVSSDAISAVHNAPVLAGGVATGLPHLGLLNTASGLIKQVSSEAASTAEKAAVVAEGVHTEVHGGVASAASGLLKHISSDAASAAQKAPGFPFGRRF